MTKPQEVPLEIQSVLFEALQVRGKSPDMDLIASGALDSLRLIDLLERLEQRFKIRFNYQALEVEDFRSPASIAALVARYDRTGVLEMTEGAAA